MLKMNKNGKTYLNYNFIDYKVDIKHIIENFNKIPVLRQFCLNKLLIKKLLPGYSIYSRYLLKLPIFLTYKKRILLIKKLKKNIKQIKNLKIIIMDKLNFFLQKLNIKVKKKKLFKKFKRFKKNRYKYKY